MTDKSLAATWQVFRLVLRGTVAELAKSHTARINALPLEPTDPERLQPFVVTILAELEQVSDADEASPVLRAAKKVFRPSAEEKARRRLKKAFDDYVKAWRAGKGT